MMSNDIFADMRAAVLAALSAELPDLPADLAAKAEVTPAREAAHGDMATNAAMVCARHAGRKPAELAQALAARLSAAPGVARAEPAGPGFINIDVAPGMLRGVLPAVLRAGAAFGDGDAGGGLRVNVEYVSANPTGPLTVGHCRGAVVGDALANLMAKAGYAITKEYYVNDSGKQVAALAWTVYWRYLQALGTAMDEEAFAAQAPGGLQYRGDYLVPVGERLALLHGDALAGPGLTVADPALWLETVRAAAIADMLAEIREDLALLGVRQDVFTSEQAVLDSGAPDAEIARLDAAGLIYEGVLEPPKGKAPDDWEPRPQTLFRSTRFGDDVDRPLRKSDGSNTYFANDIAYHADKLARGAELLIDVLGADHGGYVKRMQAATRAMGGQLDVVLCQIVHVVRGGVPVRMSKRAGTYVTLRDLIEEVGADAVRFTMLTRKADAQMEFDLDAVVARANDNPVFYVQYAHARCRSVLRAAAEMFGADRTADAALADMPNDSLTTDAELAVLRRIAAWPRTVQGAALAREPHRIAFYLYELAGDFNMLWARGNSDSTLRFLRPDHMAETFARTALVAAVATVIRSGLAVMGVAPVEEMR